MQPCVSPRNINMSSSISFFLLGLDAEKNNHAQFAEWNCLFTKFKPKKKRKKENEGEKKARLVVLLFTFNETRDAPFRYLAWNGDG